MQRPSEFTKQEFQHLPPSSLPTSLHLRRLFKQKREQERQALNELKAATALRDKFALYAMHAMITHGNTRGRNPKHISSVSYDIADAMLEKRNEQKEEEE